MEFMDQADLMRLVQFWIVVDGFRNPLEDEMDEEPAGHSGPFPSWTESDRADITQIHDAYLSKPELKILPEAKQAVAKFLKAGRKATPQEYYDARRALLRAQTDAYDQLQEPYFRRFKRSNLYYKWLAMDEAANPSRDIGTQSIAQTLDNPAVAVPAMTRSQSTQRTMLKLPAGDLRRAVASSSDLKTQGVIKEFEPPLRRSLDVQSPTTPRPPLFDNDYDTDTMAQSTASLDSDFGQNHPNGNNSKVVDAMHAA